MSLKDDADTIARRYIIWHGEVDSWYYADRLIRNHILGTWNHTLGHAVLRNLSDPVKVTETEMNTLHEYALKINPTGVVTEIYGTASGPRVRFLEKSDANQVMSL